MFKLIKKIIKWSLISVVGLFTLATILAFSIDDITPEQLAAREQARIERALSDALGEATKVPVPVIVKVPSAEDHLAQFTTNCIDSITRNAKFPSEVDHNWLDGNDHRIFDLFDDEGNTRVLIRRAGKMMNGLGMMIPFTASCKYNYKAATNKFTTVEVLIN